MGGLKIETKYLAPPCVSPLYMINSTTGQGACAHDLILDYIVIKTLFKKTIGYIQFAND